MPTGAKNDTVFADLPTGEEEQVQQATKPAMKANPEPEEDNIPDKFRGKSKAEIAESYAQLEARLGEQSTEIGSLRRMTEQLLDNKRVDDLVDNGAAPESISTDDILDDPHNAVTSVASQVVEPLGGRVAALESQLELREFEMEYPSFQEDPLNPEFVEYVNSSPYRSALANKVFESSQSGRVDYGAARELWQGWSEVKSSASDDTEQAPKKAPENDPSKVGFVDSTTSPDVVDQGKPIYSKADIMKVYQTDQARYESPAFQKAINEAAKEGRIK